jgi:hypothetical protein
MKNIYGYISPGVAGRAPHRVGDRVSGARGSSVRGSGTVRRSRSGDDSGSVGDDSGSAGDDPGSAGDDSGSVGDDSGSADDDPGSAGDERQTISRRLIAVTTSPTTVMPIGGA